MQILDRAKAILRTTSEAQAHAWLLAFAAARGLVDVLWVPPYANPLAWALGFFNTLIYIYTLYLVIPGLAGWILQRVFARRADMGKVQQQTVVLWFLYTAVGIISAVTKGPFTTTISWFRYIPTFMVDNNFLPSGMIAVIPFIVIGYVLAFRNSSDAGLARSAAAVLIGLWFFYLYFYQYTPQLFVYLYTLHGVLFAYGVYNLTFILPILPFMGNFDRAFGRPGRGLRIVLLVASLVSLGLLAAGLALKPVMLLGGQSSKAPRIQWKIQLFQLFSDEGHLTAHGYLVATPVQVSDFALYENDQAYRDTSLVSHGTDFLSYGELLRIDIPSNAPRVQLDWNRTATGHDPFLESFRGTDAITTCSGVINGVQQHCYILDENLSADLPPAWDTVWTKETFIAVLGDGFGFVAQSYDIERTGDNYTDGIAVIGGKNYVVTSVERNGEDVRIGTDGGKIVARCLKLALFSWASQVRGVPRPQVDSPLHCSVTLPSVSGERVKADGFGVMDWIGE